VIPDLLCKFFGPNWRTTGWHIVTAIFGFVALKPDLFHDWPLLVELSRYLALGGYLAGGFVGADAKHVQNATGADPSCSIQLPKP
jgi:hypothetical protein